MNWRLIQIPLILIFAITLLYITWALIAFRDIPVDVLEKRYGGENLRILNVAGIPVRYKVEGSGPPIVLLHSHFWTMRQWQPWVDKLSDRFTLIRFDMTSHGLTGPDPENDYSREKSAQIIDALLAEHGIPKASIVGSSSGGAIGFHYAATRPEKVSHLILMNTPAVKVSNETMKRKMPSWGGYLFYLMPTAIFKPFLEFAVVDKNIITDELVEEFHEMFRRDGNRMAEFHRMNAWEKADPAATLARVTAPTLIMWGRENPQLPVSSVQAFKSRLINAEKVQSIIYENTGHVIPVEIPDQSADDAVDFILSN